MRTRHFLAALLWIVAPMIIAAVAQDANQKLTENKTTDNTATATDKMTIKRVFTTNPERENNQVEAGIGNRIRVQVDNLSKAPNLHRIALYLDGLELKEVFGIPISVSDGILEYELKRTELSKGAWNVLLGSSKSSRREVLVSVGSENAEAVGASNPKIPPTMQLRVFYRGWLYGTSIILLLALIVFWRIAKTTNILRDVNPPSPPTGKMKPYSLGRTQMAFWFFLVVGSFIYIYLITGDYHTITDQALILIGIGTGTALGAAAIDSNKRTTADNELYTLVPEREKLNAEIEQLRTRQTTLSANAAPTTTQETELGNIKTELPKKVAELAQLDNKIAGTKSSLEKPVSEGLFSDLLSDAYGPSFHRYQILIWTVVLGVLFITGVYQTLAMPGFDATLLALMGISSGTYLGFKIPEQQNTTTQP